MQKRTFLYPFLSNMRFLQVTAYVDGIGPAQLEHLCQTLDPPPTGRIIEFEDDRDFRYQQFQCHWTFGGPITKDDVSHIMTRIVGLQRGLNEMGGSVVRMKVGVPMDTGPPNLLDSYFEWIVPMTAKNRKGACRGLRRNLKERMNLEVEVARDCLEMMRFNGVARFFVKMRLQSVPLENAMKQFVSLNDFLDSWRRSEARILNEPFGVRIVYDSNGPFVEKRS